MKRLIVCGDSFMSPVIGAPGTHFTEVFSKEHNFKMTVYARAAMSNGGIILQLEQALKDKPSLIFFNTTNCDRIEFIKDNTELDRPIQLNDICYKSYSADLSSVTNNFDGKIISDNIVSILNDPPAYEKKHQIYPEKLIAVKTYFSELYCNSWKWQQDSMMFYYIFHKLHLSKIPYIWIHDNLPLKIVDWLLPKNNVCEKINEFRKMMKASYKDPGYHTTPEIQVLIADFISNHYNKYFKQDIEQ